MTVPLTHAAEGLERRAFTVKDVLRMVEIGVLGHDERFELIGGEIVPMSPRGIRHEVVKQWLNTYLVKHLPDDLHTIPETTFYLSDDTFIEPDFVVYPAGRLADLSPENCLLAIEIADSSLRYDLGRKAQLYAEFGIREMWVIDAKTRSCRIHREPRDGKYAQVTDLPAGTVLKPLAIPAIGIDLAAIDSSPLESQ
ncbi:MAG: hypothetical protein BroJett030_20390 [Alphaproteobacteria bacterium]|nr:MAG: hypothetical protein BroJett030_20390 [Alphaproteobacteria bacterium]